MKNTGTFQGAEATVRIEKDRVLKQRLPKAYRLPALDAALRKQRTRREARLLQRLSGVIRVPAVLEESGDTLVLEKIHGEPLKRHVKPQRCQKAGELVGKMHSAQVIHGDLTTSNLMVEHIGKDVEQKNENGNRIEKPEKQECQIERIALVDFGLAYSSHKFEDMATDVHVFEELVPVDCFEAFWKGYEATQPKAHEVKIRREKLKSRGRYRQAQD